MTDTEEEKHTLTALDYIEKQEQLEKEAQSILPGKFEKCTFPLGYVRQALYACKTCSNENEDAEPAGMCYSCSIACHSSHELFELFPKRAFRCDCGLQNKFGGHACSLMIPAKKIVKVNDKNEYNHNFEGRYCRCDVHYDPEKEEGTMYQCIACEDWFHENCIGNIPEAIEDFECYVCRSCTKKYPFLMNGKDDRFSIGLSKGGESISKWVISESQIIVPGEVLSAPTEKAAVNADGHTLPVESTTVDGISTPISECKVEVNTKANDEKPLDFMNDERPLDPVKEEKSLDPVIPEKLADTVVGEKRKHEEEPSDLIIPNTFKKSKTDDGCQNIDISLLPEHDNIEIFLQENWREGLCKCDKCVEDYKKNNVEFLLAEEKTYEPEEDEDAGKSIMEVGMEQLQRVDRVQALESLMAYKTLADDIKNYFETFKNTGKVVTKQDIDAFFAAKRQERQERK